MSKPWTLFEFFFTSARRDVDAASQFGHCIDLYNKYKMPGIPGAGLAGANWLDFVKQLQLPWPERCGYDLPPSVPYNGGLMHDGHLSRIVQMIQKILGTNRSVPAVSTGMFFFFFFFFFFWRSLTIRVACISITKISDSSVRNYASSLFCTTRRARSTTRRRGRFAQLGFAAQRGRYSRWIRQKYNGATLGV